MNKIHFQEKLLSWYDSSKRVLPWRNDKDPYKIWISEIMLQQTKVETVIPYFNRFINKYPTVFDLSVADQDELLKMWEGLGYYSRIRNIHKASKIIVEKHNGVIPINQKELEALPGIGPYTSGAILSIAYEQQRSAVDGNVLRVFARLLRIKEDIKDKEIKSKIKTQVEKMLPTKRVGDFNQGLMEIGATVCLPNGKPICSLCPFNEMCKAYQKGEIDIIPIKRKSKVKKEEEVIVYVFKHNNTFGIEKRENSGLLASMYQFPNTDQSSIVLENYIKKEKKKLPSSKHIFTHKIWKLEAYLIELDKPIEGLQFVTKEELLNKYSIPVAFKKYKEIIQKDLI